MSNEVNVKILLVLHRPCALINLKSIVPMHAGRAVALEKSKDGVISQNDLNWMLENTIGDDTGDNISSKNRYYSECSVIYWAWKNYASLGNPDYIGLMHYRRHFIFNTDYYESKSFNKHEKLYNISKEVLINSDYCSKIGLSDTQIQQACADTDIIVSGYTRFNLKGFNLRQDYLNNSGTKIKDFDLLIDTVLRLYPEYKSSLEKHINGYEKLSFNMFIMKKEIFFDYAKFLFDILFDMGKNIDFSSYSLNGKRTLGYIAELVESIYVWRLQELNKVRIKHLGVSLVECPDRKVDIDKFLSERCPSYIEYLINKLKYLLANDKKVKSRYLDLYKQIKNKRKQYIMLKKHHI